MESKELVDYKQNFFIVKTFLHFIKIGGFYIPLFLYYIPVYIEKITWSQYAIKQADGMVRIHAHTIRKVIPQFTARAFFADPTQDIAPVIV